jgi:phospholipid/cholesterol/gamma-HCH transport system substrate-binding protein
VVRINIRESIRIPVDSSARILADGLLGDSYLSIEPGGDVATLEPGQAITHTQDAVNLLDLFARFAIGPEEGANAE